MRIVAASTRRVRWPIEAIGAARGRDAREAVLLAVRTDTGATGLGEAAPLGGMSIDTIEDAERALGDFVARLPLAIDSPGHATGIADRVATAPAARFAIETALLVALAQHARASVASLWGGVPQAELRCSVVVDDERDAHATAAGWLKIKVSDGDFAADLARVQRIARAAPHARLRLDANRAWPRDEVGARMRALAELPIEYIEEPCAGAHELLDESLPIRIALDESLIALSPVELEGALRSPQLAAIVLKPTLLGGFARCFALAEAARAHGVAPVVTHALEGPIGTAACIELARALAADVPVGLAPHPALTVRAYDSRCDSPGVP